MYAYQYHQSESEPSKNDSSPFTSALSDKSCDSPRCNVPPARALRANRSSHLSAFSFSVSFCRGLSSSRNVSGERLDTADDGEVDCDSADPGEFECGDKADAGELDEPVETCFAVDA